MKKETILQVITASLALLFFYAALSKLIDFKQSKAEMLNQIFPDPVAMFLVWAIPIAELFTAGLLLYKKTRLTGLYTSFILMTIFILYISLTMSGLAGKTPCSCGGILKHMSYITHLIFNFFFLILAILGIRTEQR